MGKSKQAEVKTTYGVNKPVKAPLKLMKYKPVPKFGNGCRNC